MSTSSELYILFGKAGNIRKLEDMRLMRVNTCSKNVLENSDPDHTQDGDIKPRHAKTF